MTLKTLELKSVLEVIGIIFAEYFLNGTYALDTLYKQEYQRSVFMNWKDGL